MARTAWPRWLMASLAAASSAVGHVFRRQRTTGRSRSHSHPGLTVSHTTSASPHLFRPSGSTSAIAQTKRAVGRSLRRRRAAASPLFCSSNRARPGPARPADTRHVEDIDFRPESSASAWPRRGNAGAPSTGRSLERRFGLLAGDRPGHQAGTTTPGAALQTAAAPPACAS